MVHVHHSRRHSQPENIENFVRVIFIPRLAGFHLHPAHAYALLQQQEETLRIPNRSSPKYMENFMGVIFIPTPENMSNVLIETDCQPALMLRVGELDEDDPMKSKNGVEFSFSFSVENAFG
ncbi:hypothetical protein L2E82_18115 [Cichorium intybus]|uniref:Uncharacterized protein n=1 Tax=Cichorium intybus TaxID=13427 RepID=A0ACB9F9W5_CICIN|nr:hypothetical protein L2E82_18115 [Cichorium intybus]